MSSQVSFSCNSKIHYSLAGIKRPSFFPVKSMTSETPFRRIAYNAKKTGVEWSFIEGSRVVLRPQFERICSNPSGFYVSSALITSSQIATTAFTWGTVAVLPFYTLMVLAPRANLTKRLMESNIPYGALGILYGYLLYLSWTPETLRVIFATKHLLPELPGMMKMFANEMTMASAWIHLLAVDLYAARQVFHDGLKNNVETRHSVTLCLLFCPIGVLAHAITKASKRLVSVRRQLSVEQENNF